MGHRVVSRPHSCVRATGGPCLCTRSSRLFPHDPFPKCLFIGFNRPLSSVSFCSVILFPRPIVDVSVGSAATTHRSLTDISLLPPTLDPVPRCAGGGAVEPPRVCTVRLWVTWTSDPGSRTGSRTGLEDQCHVKKGPFVYLVNVT